MGYSSSSVTRWAGVDIRPYRQAIDSRPQNQVSLALP